MTPRPAHRTGAGADAMLESPAWHAARGLAAALVDQLPVPHPAAAPASGRSRPRACPDWCAQGHRCTVGRLPDGEHRSDPLAWDTRYGRLLVTLTQRPDARIRVELRTVVGLDDSPDLARYQAQRLAIGVDLTVRAVLDEIHRVA